MVIYVLKKHKKYYFSIDIWIEVVILGGGGANFLYLAADFFVFLNDNKMSISNFYGSTKYLTYAATSFMNKLK